jgi:hypothetical protein
LLYKRKQYLFTRVLRGAWLVLEDPLSIVLGLVETWRLNADDRPPPESFGEIDLRLANRDGARISAAEIAAILEQRATIVSAHGRSLPMRRSYE